MGNYSFEKRGNEKVYVLYTHLNVYNYGLPLITSHVTVLQIILAVADPGFTVQ